MGIVDDAGSVQRSDLCQIVLEDTLFTVVNTWLMFGIDGIEGNPVEDECGIRVIPLLFLLGAS